MTAQIARRAEDAIVVEIQYSFLLRFQTFVYRMHFPFLNSIRVHFLPKGTEKHRIMNPRKKTCHVASSARVYERLLNIIREYSVCLSISEFHPTALRKILSQRQIFEKSRFLLAYETLGSRTLIHVEISNDARLRLRNSPYFFSCVIKYL